MQEKSTKTVAFIVVAALAIIIACAVTYFTLSRSQAVASPETKKETSATIATKTTIIFTNDGFTPSEYTSKAGEAVTVKNDSSQRLQFSSDDHPTHRIHPEINLTTLAPGESATITPGGAGVYHFHDHIDDSKTGTLTVQ